MSQPRTNLASNEVFTHPLAIVESTDIGAGTRVWAFSHVMAGVHIGRDCNIGEQCFLEQGVTVGDSAVIKNGVAVWEGVEIGNSVFVGPNVAFTNDLVPRAKLYRACVKTNILEGASIGANATIRCGIEIGRWALIGAGCVVVKDVPDFAIVVGNPGRVKGYVCKCGAKLKFNAENWADCACGLRFRIRDGIVFVVSEAAKRGNEL